MADTAQPTEEQKAAAVATELAKMTSEPAAPAEKVKVKQPKPVKVSKGTTRQDY